MGSPYSKLLNSPEIQDIKSKFTLDELQTLSRIYTDLSARDYEVISKETFLQFFGLTGLWGERIFERFDIKHTENLGFAGFLKGLASYCKCNEEEKIKLLFSLYDMDNDGYINRLELITMLYNFPKHYLREIIDDVAGDGGERMERFNEDRRKKTMTHIDLDDEGLFKPNILASPKATKMPVKEERSIGDLSDLIIAEEETDDVLDNVLYRNLKAPRFNVPVGDAKDNNSLHHVNDKVEGEGGAKATSLQYPGSPQQKSSLRNQKNLTEPPQLRGSAKKLTINGSTMNKIMEESRKEPATGSSYNRMSTIMMDQSYMISTTFNVRVKEYASIMFKGCEGAQRTGKINFDEFKKWLTLHKVLLKVFDGAFHQDLWMTGNYESKTSHSPLTESQRFISKESPLERQQSSREVVINGILYKKGKKTGSWKPRYYELKGPFLSYYTNKDKTCLKGVLFLDGCSITEISGNPKGGRYGFSITHKSESYKPHFLYCDSKTKFDEWMGKLKVFNSTSIADFYQLKEEIGTGKFSTVYKAINNKDKKEYAIKSVQKDKLQPSEKAAILSETSVMKMLDHPTTIKLIETIEVKNNLYIVMELVRDGDLFDYVMSKQFVEETEASLIMKQLLASVNYLHSVGIIHRDLKPENIMITKNPEEDRVKEIKLIDFGFAKFLSNNTLMTEACGTPNYLAPEVIKGSGYDKKSDVFSLGIIMYFLIRGLLPFDAMDVKQILLLTFKCEVSLEDEHWQNISPEGKDLLMKLLAKEPGQRIEIEEALKHPWIKNREGLKKYEGVNPKNEGQAEE